MNKSNEQNNSSYAELILFSAETAENESDSQPKPEPKRLIPGMFSSISEAELITNRLIYENIETDDFNT